MHAVRPMAHDDVPIAICLAKAMHGLSPVYRDFEFSHERVSQFFVRAIDDPSWLCLVAVDRGGEIEGVLVAQCFIKFFSNDCEALDMGIFTPKPGDGIGRKLIDAYVSWAKEQGARRIVIQAEAGMELESLVFKLSHMGFKPSGFSMVYGGD